MACPSNAATIVTSSISDPRRVADMTPADIPVTMDTASAVSANSTLVGSRAITSGNAGWRKYRLSPKSPRPIPRRNTVYCT